ncbi:dienelactone hydrolase family protein [Azospirillum rugosum]|uniref:Carboxymethylenebutenolidase n=1 Tax=Azospirillum rugosum TaxID=416170 RepID=A0ABS4SI43_9PROT|nr:dienelactone hydrolase family protein [Azospirillum rugosum]MBP2292241.1 carboxymethylenebutenolidase [Azospirillum rugosum]MDQ0526000.1 carboxymethylenebutenolidase [Azospirillum rugosum]
MSTQKGGKQQGNWLDLTASDGHRFRGYEARPAGAEKGQILVIQEIFGVNNHIRNVCEDFAAEGYRALAPALFDRAERDVELAYDDAGIQRGREIMGKVTIDDALKDVAAGLAHLGGDGAAAIVGYCWGGTVAWAAAQRLVVRAAIGYYGGGIANRLDEAPRAPTLLHFGEKDHAIPLTVADSVRDRHPSVMVHLYPAGHGFNCDERASYDAESAALAKQRTLGLLRAVF